eukprot:CAMPEP_0202690260 /NCGR_PEP_ID=MMETSP1385-20130828/5296_1 /ASSEMBLY_ACC=CAM_ASM_000861 /TAXON_ID=933848 /ORGANISM="Elphidium margaritaceum" /LENGTH=444 /DNA_ID=CAMNT_0049345497 /DNA_START=31 /DNA_END=1365 /DNA_ORIENTATION=+
MTDAEYTSLSLIPNVVESLRTSFNDGITLPYSYRIQQLKNLRKLVSENADAIIRAEQADMYKRPRSELEMTAVGFVLKEIDHLVANLAEYMKPTAVPEAANLGKGQLVQTPRGVVLIIGPWNFPTNLVLCPLAGAIAAGCTSVVKPSEVAANVSALMQKLIPSYLDRRCVAVVTGAVPQTSALLSQKFNLVFFTGSPVIGKIIATAAAKHLTPVVLELGGKNPVVVDDAIDLDKVAEQIAEARYGLNCGQVCTAPEYVILSAHRQQAFVQAMMKAIKRKFGENEKMSAQLSRLKNRHHAQRLQTVLRENREHIVYGGDCDLDELYVQPSIVANADASTRIMQEEVFGPVLTIFPVQDVYRDAIRVLQSYPKPLQMRVYSDNQRFVQDIVARTDSGGVSINSAVSHFRVEGFPFGGSGWSGCGRYHGKYSFEAFSREKPVLQAKL